MCTKETPFVLRFVSQSPKIREIMNMKLDRKPKNKLKKLKIDMFPRSKRRTPEIPPVLSTKRVKNCVNADKKTSQNNVNKLRSTLNNTQQSKEKSVLKPGTSTGVQDVFGFPFESVGKPDTDSEVKQSVLRTISKMLEENRAFRQRGLILTQMTQRP